MNKLHRLQPLHFDLPCTTFLPSQKPRWTFYIADGIRHNSSPCFTTRRDPTALLKDSDISTLMDSACSAITLYLAACVFLTSQFGSPGFQQRMRWTLHVAPSMCESFYICYPPLNVGHPYVGHPWLDITGGNST